MAFVDALRKVDAKIRHSPTVQVFTSARMDGRAEVGLSGQLRHWKNDAECGTLHLVDSAEWLEHRFRTMALLRQINQGWLRDFSHFPQNWQQRILQLQPCSLPTPRFLDILDCDTMITEMCDARLHPRRAQIQQVIAALTERITAYTPSPMENPVPGSDINQDRQTEQTKPHPPQN